MNKTLVTLGFLLLILAALVGFVLLAVFRPEQLPAFTGAVTTILGVGTAAIVTIYGLGSQGEKLKRIEAQTNGNLSRLQSENERLTDVLIRAGIDPTVVPTRGSHAAGG